MDKSNKQRIIKISLPIIMLGIMIGFVMAFLNLEAKNDDINNDKRVVCALKKEDEVCAVSSAKIGSMGDLLIHKPVFRAFYNENSNSYDFTKAFSYIAPYIKKLDYAVVDIEGTLADSDFSGYPVFRCPDSLVDAAMDCGFDMFLLANNHSNDNGSVGFRRTQQVLKAKNAEFIGTRSNIDDDKYIIKTINGIKLGFVNYTYGNIYDDGIASVNGIPLSAQNSKLINVFDYNRLDMFYKEQQDIIDNMRKTGVDKIIYYMHWGNEYQIKENDWQRKISQKLSDLGVDIIIGGHPHVVQPIDVIHSDISNKDTICIYSMGNALSNQRVEYMDMKTGHTEDGVLFMFTCTKYSDGKVLVSSVDVVPTWVNLRYHDGGNRVYQILPLEAQKEWKDSFELTKQEYECANKSYNRTMDILGEGLGKAKELVLDKLKLDYPDIYR